MGRGVEIRRVGGKKSMSRGVKIPWLRVSKYHGWVRYTMDRGQYTMDMGFDIPWVVGSRYHG